MTLLGVGIDLVRVEEVRAALASFGDRYLDRVFTARELSGAKGEGEVRAGELAARFAAKEAAMKALAPSDHLPDWRSIEVQQEEGGGCTLLLSGYAAELAGAAQLREFAVSLSHEGDLALAVVFATGGDEA